MKGWWSGGFGYGLWIGILVGLGFSVVPVPSLLWKNKFELTGSMSTKVGCPKFPTICAFNRLSTVVSLFLNAVFRILRN